MFLALAPVIVGLVLTVLAVVLLATEVTVRLAAAAGRIGMLTFRR